MQERKVAQYFGITFSTLHFILLNIATLGIFYFIWMWKFINRVSSDTDKSTNRVLVIVIFACYSWASVFSSAATDVSLYDNFIEMAESSGIFSVIGGMIYLAYLVLTIVLSFKTKRSFEQLLEKNNCRKQLNGILCFIIPFIYQYYITYNAETLAGGQGVSQNTQSIGEQIEKLRQLKESGSISEEEFEQAKNKLLS